MSKKPSEINPEPAKRLKELLMLENVTQEKLSDLIHLSQQSISRIIQKKQSLTDQTARAVIKVFPNYRIEWLLGFDDIMTHTDDLRNLIHNKVDTAEAINQVISLIADDICRREKIPRKPIPFMYDFSILQTQLHEYAELIVSDYLKNRKNSRFWKRMDSEYPMNRGDSNETGKR